MSRAYFEILEARAEDRLRLALKGELDLGSAPQLRDRLRELSAEKRLVRLDLSELEFIDSSGVDVLLWAVSDAAADGWQLDLDPELAPQVRRVLQLLGLERSLLQGDAQGLADGSYDEPAGASAG